MADIRLDGKVAIVTGAGGGLGREHALLLAARGAKVVVNDLGSAVDGTGNEQGFAERVVNDITDRGGVAVADTHGVETYEGAQAVVQTAIDTFGKIDIVVNNAGILRDKSFGKMEVEDFNKVLSVHLGGTFGVSRAAWNHLKEQGSGRIVNTSSGSGLYGNFGQANYAAAKMAIVGLTRTLAIEGHKYGIRCNAIAPMATSRMTTDVLPPVMREQLGPEKVSGLVVYLCSDLSDENGFTYSVGGGYVARVAIMEGEGVVVGGVPSPEQIAQSIDAINEVGPDSNEVLNGVMGQNELMARAVGIDFRA